MTDPPVLAGKGRTLDALSGRLRTARILPLVRLSVDRWRKTRDPGAVVARLGEGPLIVRSSAAGEDGATASLAGRYLSVPDVTGVAALAEAIDRVVASYGTGDPLRDEVLVQPQLRGVSCAGVVFSRDPNTGAPYRVVNVHDGADTAAVTAGKAGTRTVVRSVAAPVPPPPDLAGVFALVEELEGLFPDVPLDVEFAVADGSLHLLQVRRLTATPAVVPPEAHGRTLARVADRIAAGRRPHPFLHGRTTAYGVMPDWNPAEMIGVRPRPLALSLYRELVTDSIWAYQRHNYGYKNLRSFPLMVDFCGLPYIDVRVSFNSFVPADVDDRLAGRLVDHYVERLLAAPELHDKVEFEIVFSCYSFDLDDRMAVLADAGFSADDRAALTNSLRRLTNRIIDPRTGLWRADRDRIETLDVRRARLDTAALGSVERLYWLLEDCKRYGTLPFAGLARAGFVAVQILKSLVAVGVFSPADYDAFMGGLSTVSGQLARDIRTLDRTAFLARYGHLRPGTYDIRSLRYDEAPDLYFDWETARTARAAEPDRLFALSIPQMRELAHLLSAHGLEPDVVGLLDFLQAGIELREAAKFRFTRNVSDALSLLADYGTSLGFDREDMSFVDVRTVYRLQGGSDDPCALIGAAVQEGRRRHAETLGLWMPPVVRDPVDVWQFEVPATVPNFVTQRSITAPVVSHANRDRLAGAIVAIPNADPGFDWLFSWPIAGLVTAYGGANSHMAIRAGELGLPSVIGAGEAQFALWSRAALLRIDCAARRVEVLR
ncbi:MAG: PEP/pyruvate-binding domain-containing protein [Rhodospirillales bacterium]|jgi:phosphohistidine swiveling domain-containing protein